jgi:hypothetical protein
MSTQGESRTPLLRFVDSFLQERNIKWVLAAGMLILLGSSLMMVTSQWRQIADVWKYLIFLGYTGVIYAAAQWSYHHWMLRKTGTVLMSLTVLMIPILFVAWHWLWASGAGDGARQVLYLGLLALTAVMSTVAARRIFHHFLHGPQPTFLASYLTLSFAGAVAPSVAAWAPETSWVASFVLYLVFVAGSVKVNRHVFWLAEEHHAPRVLGFFPIALLGGQFLSLFAANFAMQVPPQWLGLGCVLVAVPVLLTADTVARVFQQRTGDLVRPLPWSIVLPLTVGLVLCAAGVCLAGIGIAPPRLPYAMVPTAALAAMMMAVAARRTGKAAFVWAMLFGVLLAYNFTPVLFRELARQTISMGAKAVNEQRLPYAFYGLTYLPLILVLTAAAAYLKRQGHHLFAKPIERFGVALSLLLLATSFGHEKAVFPVATTLTLVFALQAVVFEDRKLVLAAVLAWFSAALGLAPFVAGVLGHGLPPGAPLLCLAAAAVLLLIPGCWIDRFSARLPLAGRWRGESQITAEFWQSLCQLSSLTAAVGVAMYWLVWYGWLYPGDRTWPALAVVSVLLIVHSLRWVQPILSWFTYLFIAAAALLLASFSGVSTASLISLVTLQLLAQWLLAYGLERWPNGRVSQAFLAVCRHSSLLGLSLGFAVVYVPLMIGHIVEPALPVSVPPVWWPCYVLITAWSFDAARRTAQPLLTVLGCTGVLLLVGATLVTAAGADARQWLPAAWAATAVAALPLALVLRRTLDRLDEESTPAHDFLAWHSLTAPIEYFVQTVLAIAAVGSLVSLAWPMRVAGAISLLGLLVLATVRRQPLVRCEAWALINWQVILLIVLLICPGETSSWLQLLAGDNFAIHLPVALAASLSLLAWQCAARRQSGAAGDIGLVQRSFLRIAAASTLMISALHRSLDPIGIVLAAATFAALVISELRAAWRSNDPRRVWVAEAVALAAVAYFANLGLITLAGDLPMFAVLGIGVAVYAAGRLAGRRGETSVLAKPFELTGFAMPLVTVAIGVICHLLHDPTWLGANSLALLLATGFYFWQGLERGRKSLLVLSAATLNVSLALLWRELAWSDPQFYMIPLGASILALVSILQREIPEAMRNPLRYLGALVILVSPTFHIVGGSWLHLFTLMVASVAVLLVSIGLRVRALMYTGTAFLIADLIGIIVRGSVDRPGVLWIAGIAFGSSIVLLGAICENNREKVLQRMRAVSAKIEQWN